MSFGFEMDYRIGNRKVSRAQWERHMREAPIEALKGDIQAKVSRVRCPTHGGTARVSFRKTSKGFDTELSGCCDELMERVQRAMG